jgi:hypothetical protein
MLGLQIRVRGRARIAIGRDTAFSESDCWLVLPAASVARMAMVEIGRSRQISVAAAEAFTTAATPFTVTATAVVGDAARPGNLGKLGCPSVSCRTAITGATLST